MLPTVSAPVYFLDSSPEAIPTENGMSSRVTAVFPVFHTLYDYYEGF
jgi:hypothetical protein